jgi:hypothetical protein
VADRQQKL